MNGRRRAAPVRPRYGRIAMAAMSTSVTAIAVLGGAGALPSAAVDDGGGRGGLAPVAANSRPNTEQPSAGRSTRDQAHRAPSTPAPATTPARSDADDSAATGRAPSTGHALPPGSGTGRRVVFSEGEQRVWLVAANGETRRTYPVSGSVYDNLQPGSYSVYSRSEQAWGIDDSGSMKYFVRFAQGDNAAIGFHDIPIDDGQPVQSVDQLGTPLSHGCIRQRRADAKALWAFAPLGTKVVVTA